MKRDVNTPSIVIMFILIPVLVLVLTSCLFPDWGDQVTIAVIPSAEIAYQITTHLEPPDFIASSLLYALPLIQLFGYALAVSSAMQRDRLKPMLFAVAIFHVVVIVLASCVLPLWKCPPQRDHLDLMYWNVLT